MIKTYIIISFTENRRRRLVSIMDYLPSEILEKIFLDKVIDHRDLAKLQCVCKRFNDISNSNDIWCSKFKHAFPQLFQQIDDNHIVNNVSWKQELKKRLEIVEFVKDNLEKLSQVNYNKQELSKSDYYAFDDLLVQHHHDKSFVHLYITDELSRIIASGSVDQNLTEKVKL